MNEEDVDRQLNKLENEIGSLTRQRDQLTRRINKLKSESEELKTSFNLKKSLKVDAKLSSSTFEWSKKAQEMLETTFKLKAFRLQQLAAVNATLSKKDALLLMPTGGGKTLCYQLPAMLETGMTLVISPLLALMEDQLIQLRKLNICAVSMSSGTSKEVKTQGFQYMTKGIGKEIKLMYVTPEWLAKSKKFMSSLQKLHEAKKLNRIAIDEVHCCSQWGHDFRPDYKFLGLLKGMFPDIPIIGLTATATMSVLSDIQNMLDIPDCAIIRAPFDRSNLSFNVVPKAEKAEETYDYLEHLLRNKFNDQTGIIYTATIKDCEEVTKALMSRGLNVKHYHADLPDERRTKTHNQWLKEEVKTIVATVAFGMGIDKPNVRFVIHYSTPKSMETLYQESGRAGRDGEKSMCIVMFKLSDYLKNSGYARSKTEIKNTLSVLEYCINFEKCRHYLIGLHFEETQIRSCMEMCDNCKNKRSLGIYDAKPAYDDIYKVMEAAASSDNNLTLNKLLDLWMKPKVKIRKPNVSREQAECIIGNLIIKQCVREEKSFTPYSVICYLRPGVNSDSLVEIVLKCDSKIDGYLKLIQTVSDKRAVKENVETVNRSNKKRKIDSD